MYTRLTISFTPEEGRLLQAMAEADCRPPKDQLRHLLRQEARQRGLLPFANQQVKAQVLQNEVNYAAHIGHGTEEGKCL